MVVDSHCDFVNHSIKLQIELIDEVDGAEYEEGVIKDSQVFDCNGDELTACFHWMNTVVNGILGQGEEFL